MLPIKGSIEGVNGKARAEVKGLVVLTIELYSGKSFDIQFYVCPDYSGGLLIGFKQVNKMSTLIDCRSG